MLNLFTVLFKKHKKHLPSWLAKTAFGEILRYGFMIFLSAWIFQGMLYMDKREALFKILLDIMLVVAFRALGLSVWGSLLIAHSVNFAFNGQWCAMYTHMGATNVPPEKFLSYIAAMQKRIDKCNYITSATAHGSLSLGNYKSTSDMDIRVSPAPGGLNWVRAVCWAAVERARSFVSGFPLDMYLFDLDIIAQKMRNDEPPIVLKGQHTLSTMYSETINFSDFTALFSKKNCQ
jgi:DNA-binding transcriptional ArsR family regulator